MIRLLLTSRKRITQTIAIVWLISAGATVAQAQVPELPPAYYPPSAQPTIAPTRSSVTPTFAIPAAQKQAQTKPNPTKPNPTKLYPAKTNPVPTPPSVPLRQVSKEPTPQAEATARGRVTTASSAPAPIAPAPVTTQPANPTTGSVQSAAFGVAQPEQPTQTSVIKTSATMPVQGSPLEALPIGEVPTLDRAEMFEPIEPTVPQMSQIQRRAIERLPSTTTAVTAASNDLPNESQAFDLELQAPIQVGPNAQDSFDLLPPPEFQSPGNVYRMAKADTETAAKETAASAKGAKAKAESETKKSPTPSQTSQPTAAGGHGGYDGGYGGGCGGCGSCAQCCSPFSPDPNYNNMQFDPDWEWDVYAGKWWNCVQQPWIATGRGIYGPGPTPPAKHWFGRKNPIRPQFLLYGDYRTALAYNDNGAQDNVVWAHRLNLDFDFQWTGTERLHAFWGPLDKGNFTRIEANDDEIQFFDQFDENFDTLFFEGDLGYIWGGFADKYAPFDLPFAFGRFPLFFQNGIWFNEVIEGFAFTIPAQHFRVPTVSNWELTWFFGFDDVANPAFGNDDDIANIYGMHGFWELLEGYLETGYAFLDDQTGAGLGFHSFGFSWSRRYFHRVSNAIRVMINTGQAPNSGGRDTADGQLLLIENSWISSNPNYFVPYFNLFAGFGSPQSAARAADNILVNTGINFETDALTGYPTLDASGRDAWGGALGVNLLGPDFSWQWIVEFAWLQTFGNAANRQAVADQYAIGTRYQIPINHAWIFRMDAMHGFFEQDDDITGARAELRWKF